MHLPRINSRSQVRLRGAFCARERKTRPRGTLRKVEPGLRLWSAAQNKNLGV